MLAKETKYLALSKACPASNHQGLKTLWRRRNRQLFTYGASLGEIAYWGHRVAEQISRACEVKANGPVRVPCNIWAICGRMEAAFQDSVILRHLKLEQSFFNRKGSLFENAVTFEPFDIAVFRSGALCDCVLEGNKVREAAISGYGESNPPSALELL
ncbi:predicted protein [Histoplasma capsulatum var. duboisii H88]|uniref:Predicted protein n=1 Tax=Ajellomyces capsulatus (strain H88) TaxID=544711 RepID=F0U5A5_AJEC8|nr:predicted protein [Histoplasma capsulatum var. duboisii H88]